MPVFQAIIDEQMTHIIHPITEQLVERLFKSINVFHAVRGNIHYSSGDTAASKTADENNRPRLSDNRANIEINPNFNPTGQKWENTTPKHIPAYSISKFHRTEDASLFIDKRADIKIQETLIPCTVRLNISLQFKNKELAFRALDGIYNRHFTESIVEFADIYFSYPFPLSVFRGMYELYSMRTFEIPTTFPNYLKWGSADNVTYMKTRNGQNSEIIINKNQYRVLTELITSVEKPEAEKINKVADTWNIETEYVFQFQRPNMMRLYYPVTVDNKLIPPLLHPKKKRMHPTDIQGLHIDIAYQNYITEQYVAKYIHPLIYHPIFDDWSVPKNNNLISQRAYKEFFIGALTLDGDSNTTIDLINDLPDEYKLHQIVVDALKVQGNQSFYTSGLFNISVYANETRVDPSLLEISSDLVVKLKSTIPYRRYHLVLSELVDLKYLDPQYVPILLKFDDFFASTIIRYLDHLNDLGEIVVKDGIVYINKDRYIKVPNYGIYDGTGVSDLETPDISTGVDYDQLEGYEDLKKMYIYTKKGDPILTQQGGVHGFSNPWRIGNYIITAKRYNS